MTEPIKLPPMPLEDALKRAYYYTEAGEWRYPETCIEWDRWHSVAKVATLAVEQNTADLREALRVTQVEACKSIERLQAERDEARAEVERLRGVLAAREQAMLALDHRAQENLAKWAEARAELTRLTTLRPASEWDGETYVLWWREWDEAGWVIDSVSDSQQSDYWTPAFDAKGSA